MDTKLIVALNSMFDFEDNDEKSKQKIEKKEKKKINTQAYSRHIVHFTPVARARLKPN